MRHLARPLLTLVLVLAAPIVPFLLFGSELETALAAWQAHPRPPAMVALALIGLLATDVFLPIPSSLVTTLAGWQLGALEGALAAWIGMNLGAALGFGLARRFGRPLVGRLTSGDELDHAQRLADRWGPALLVLGRGVPVLAEATVLLVGLHDMSWRRFLPPVALANLGLAVAYAALGQLAERYQALPAAMAIALALPVVLLLAFQRIRPPEDASVDQTSLKT